MKTAFAKKIVKEIKAAGWVFARTGSNSHLIYRNANGKIITVPPKLDDKSAVSEIRRRAGLKGPRP